MTVIRHEFFGPLIWSKNHNSYFLPRTEIDKCMVLEALANRRSSRSWGDGLSECLVVELWSLGIEGPVREIFSPYVDQLSAPLEVYFDYTWSCNLAHSKCGQNSYCYAAELLGPTTLPQERVRVLMAELADWGVMRVHLAGGEPTIRRVDLANYLDSASALGIYTSIATNGLLFDDEIIEILLRNHLKSVSFSLDGASEKANAKVRGPGLFDRTIAAIRHTIKKRNNFGSNMQVCIKPVYQSSTPNEELERIVLLGIKLGVDTVKFANPERCIRHEQGYYGKQVDSYYEKLFFIQDLQLRYGDKLVITNISNPLSGCDDIGLPNLEGCIGAQELLGINPDGSITPCCMHRLHLGNILTDYVSLQDFWKQSVLLHDFWKVLKRPQDCYGCEMYPRCRSGSTIRRVVEVGRYNTDYTSGEFKDTPDPLCPQRFLSRHPTVMPPAPRHGPSEFQHFREISVLHSL